jgi:hypothetical protein
VLNGLWEGLYVRIGQFQSSLFLKWINLPILERIGRKFHTIFQSRCFSLEFSIAHRQSQSTSSRGEGLGGPISKDQGWYFVRENDTCTTTSRHIEVEPTHVGLSQCALELCTCSALDVIITFLFCKRWLLILRTICNLCQL